MSVVVVLAVLLGVASVVVLRVDAVAKMRQAEVERVAARTLDELDGRPEFAVAPADWPLRESPPRLEHQR